MGAAVGTGVGRCVGTGVGAGVGTGVGLSVGEMSAVRCARVSALALEPLWALALGRESALRSARGWHSAQSTAASTEPASRCDRPNGAVHVDSAVPVVIVTAAGIGEGAGFVRGVLDSGTNRSPACSMR